MEKLDVRTYNFALRVTKLALLLARNQAAQIVGRQLLRSGTSIGANVEEALGAISKPEFIQKMSIACKESRETHYWLRLIQDTGLIPGDLIEPLLQESLEIKMILPRTVKTSKARYGKGRYN